jgi:hypothetical protein
LLRAFIKAVLTRRSDLQRFLEMIGLPGTGKGTILRLLEALAGHENTFITELKHLETNRFETSGLRHKILVLVTDADRWSGSVSQLKGLTGDDGVRMEEKYKNPKNAPFPGMVAIAANDPIQSTDYTGALPRRRIAMAFNVQPAKVRHLLDHKGEGAWGGELAPEIPGVFNWAMAMADEDVYRFVKETGEAVPQLRQQALKAIVATNQLADWADGMLVLDEARDANGQPAVYTNVGTARRVERGVGYENEDVWLYPNYCAWADATNHKPVGMRRFASILEELLVTQLKLPVAYRKDMHGSRFFGIRLRTASDKADLLVCPTETRAMTEHDGSMTAETRTDDGYDGYDGIFEKSGIGGTHPPSEDGGEVGGSIGKLSTPENPSFAVISVIGAEMRRHDAVISVIGADESATVSLIASNDVSVRHPSSASTPGSLTDKDPCPHCGQLKMKLLKPGHLVCYRCGKNTFTTWQG